MTKNLKRNIEYNHILEKPLFNYLDDGFFISTGGNPKTCIAGSDNNSKSGFVVLGIGISCINDELRILNAELWDEVLKDFNSSQIDGHFVIIQWGENQIKVHTDLLGLRDIHLYRTDNDIYLSTNPMLFKNFTSLELDFSVFGSRWLLFNQISSESIFKGSERILSGTSLSIDRISLAIEYTLKDFIPKIDTSISIDEFDNTLSSFISLPINQNQKMSLSLSGGLDSRILLSYLLDYKNMNWSAHTFGSENNPDRIIAEKIVSDYDLTHEFLDNPLPTATEIIDELRKYTGFTFACNPASEIVQLLNYKSIQDKYDIIIDGGFGEIWRRQFLNRLYFLGKKAILKKNIPEIIKYMILPKTDIFSEDVNQLMYKGTCVQIDEMMSKLPNIKEIGLANWLDLFAVKTRLPNIYSHEQTRLDQSLICYMPFAQLSLLDLIFSIDVKQRKNSKLFRKIIAKQQSRLSKYPLSKNDFTYSFNSSPWRLVLTGKLKHKTGKIFKDDSKINFLKALSEFIGDTINSTNLKECSFYNYKNIQKISEQFRKNPNEYYKEMDWFLSFEMLRELIG